MDVKENNTCGMTIAIYYYYYLGLYIFPIISQPAYPHSLKGSILVHVNILPLVNSEW